MAFVTCDFFFKSIFRLRASEWEFDNFRYSPNNNGATFSLKKKRQCGTQPKPKQRRRRSTAASKKTKQQTSAFGKKVVLRRRRRWRQRQRRRIVIAQTSMRRGGGETPFSFFKEPTFGAEESWGVKNSNALAARRNVEKAYINRWTMKPLIVLKHFRGIALMSRIATVTFVTYYQLLHPSAEVRIPDAAAIRAKNRQSRSLLFYR